MPTGCGSAEVGGRLAQVCTHPYLLHHTRPEEEEECEVVGVSTKWQLLDRLVPLMRAQRQRALILSQSPKALDLVEVGCTRPFSDHISCRPCACLYAQGWRPVASLKKAISRDTGFCCSSMPPACLHLHCLVSRTVSHGLFVWIVS